MGERLFLSLDVSGFRMRNRSVRSATSMRMAGPRGEVTDELLSVHSKLSSGLVGMDITGHAFVSPEGRAKKGQIGVWNDDLISGLSKLTGVVERGGAIPILQISHAGMLSEPLYGEKLSPSPRLGARALSLYEIERIVDDFVRASVRAYKAGFYGVQIHAAHGYLISQFLSPKINAREDEFSPPGGGLELIRRIVRGIRQEITGKFIVSVKIGPDCGPRGLSGDEFFSVLKELSREGISFFEISRGVCRYGEIVRERIKPGRGEAYNLDIALSAKKVLRDVKVFLVGGFRTLSASSDALEKGIDAVCYSRPFIKEPHLVKRWMDGDITPSLCVSCNRCAFEPGPAMCYTTS